MTVLSLLFWILAVVLIQVAAGAVLWARRRSPQPAPAATPLPEAPATSPKAWPGWRPFVVKRRKVEDAAGSQTSFHLSPVDGQALPSFRPGQFLTLEVPTAPVDSASRELPRAVTRCYSLSDGPDPATYRITVKRQASPAHRPDVPPGTASTFLHDQLREGDVLQLKAPAGHFVLHTDPAVPVVLLGSGCGVTPLMSMLRWMMRDQPARTVHLYYGVRNGDERAFREEMAEVAAAMPAFRMTVAYSQKQPTDVPGTDFDHAGHVDLDLVRRTLPHGRHAFYLCGPVPMIASLLSGLESWGVPKGDIHFEAFTPASVRSVRAAKAEAAPAAPLSVHFTRSGRTLEWDGKDQTVLEFAERHGVAIESGCRSGGCGACATRLVSGTVSYPYKPDHDVRPGHCLPCVCSPTSTLVLEA